MRRSTTHRRRNHLFNLCDSYRWEVFDEQRHPHTEPSESADRNTNFDPREIVTTPCGGYVLSGERLEDNVETLEPHSDIDEDRKNEEERDVCPKGLNPKELREDTVTERHSPESYPELSERSEPELESLELIVAEPRGVKLSCVRVRNYTGGNKNQLAHRIEVEQRDQSLEPERLP